MPEEIILRHCSPTLAGLKTANMFSYRFSDKGEMISTLRSLNRIFCSKGISVVPLTTENGATLLYVFRPQMLSEDLKNDTARRHLSEKGYNTDNVYNCLVNLVHRFRCKNGFPHEIGFFLGYPPYDVACFMEGKKNYIPCKCCWRVYDNKDLATQKYCEYRACTFKLLESYRNGEPLRSLIA